MGIGGHHDGRRQRQWHDHGGQWQRRRQRNGRQDGGAITMRSIEIAVNGGGGNGRWWRSGRQDGRASTAGQGDGVSPSSGC